MISTLAALIFAPASSTPADIWPDGATRVYADTCLEQDSGDIGGHVIAITRHALDWRVRFQWTDGALSEPTEAQLVKFDSASGRLSFVATVRRQPASPGGTTVFNGLLAKNTLTGTLKEYWETQSVKIALRKMSAERATNPKAICR